MSNGGAGNRGVRIGILSIQGDVAENVAAISGALKDPRGFDDDSVTLVKTPRQIEGLDGLVIPGGESTTIGSLAAATGTLDAIRTRITRDGMPVLGICAGLVMLAKSAFGPSPSPSHDASESGRLSQPLLGMLDIDVIRNAFGHQRQSFEAGLDLGRLAIPKFRGVFIRAPVISRVAADVTVLCELPRDAGGDGGSDDDGGGTDARRVVAVSKGNIMGTAFHPELSGDLAVHKYFVAMVRRQSRRD